MKRSFYYLQGLVLLLVLLTSIDTSAQQRRRRSKNDVKTVRIYDIDTLITPVPLNRGWVHTQIDRDIKQADMMDGVLDSRINLSSDTDYVKLLTKTIITGGRQMEVMIENLPGADNNVKIRYLKNLDDLLRRTINRDLYDPLKCRKSFSNFKEMLIARHENRLPAFVQDNLNIYTLENRDLLDGFPQERATIFIAMAKQDPVTMIKKLADFANEPFACDVIAAAAKVAPILVYNFATSSNANVSNAVKRCMDPLTQTIVQITTKSKAPLKALPFLSDIHGKSKSIAEIDMITSTPDLFYKNLVRLKLSGITLGGESYNQELEFRGIEYVRKINELHESPDAVRFKSIENFSAEELYFLSVYGQDEIYTSSFVHGTFPLMIKHMDSTMSGSDLLEKVRYDHFRTFIRMCAGYNTLDAFLSKFETQKKFKLMHDFVSGLEKGKDDDLEDAVDVADAFSSIRDSAISQYLMSEVTKNYERCVNEKSRKGLIVYGLLATLFKGNTSELDLPPINMVPYSSLVDDKGVVYQEFFFYGDDDGKTSFDHFMNNFKDARGVRDPRWKVIPGKFYTEIRSVSGKPVVIYASMPIPEPGDEEAQDSLVKHLITLGIHPTMITHRGHSYHLPSTLEHLTKECKVVFLGSCGGYHNLAVVLDNSPDAHIISTKQTGTMIANDAIVRKINEELLAGNDLNWIKMWDELPNVFGGKKDLLATFNEYVPPHRNLGAIFVKAYRRMYNKLEMGDEE